MPTTTTTASIPTDVPRKRRGPSLRASPRGLGRGRGVLIETRAEWIAVLTVSEARELAKALLDAADEAQGSSGAVTAARDDQCRRARRPSPSSRPRRAGLDEVGQ